jgi:SAM-dependent methyltransferase
MEGTATETGYSIDNARKFGWASIGAPLSVAKLEVLDKYVVGPKTLDAGCGAGGYVDYFARKGLDATGLDKFPMFLDVAKEAGFQGTFVQGSLAERLPFADGTFDTTVCLDVLEHVDDIFAVRELARVTRKRLIITVPQEDRWMSPFQLVFSTYRDQTHLRYYTVESLRKLADSVRPQRVDIFGESLVSMRDVALKMLDPSSKYPLLSSVYKRLFRFLLFRCPDPPLFMNLAAVLDFDRKDAQPAGLVEE